jgi:hypothetical protein
MLNAVTSNLVKGEQFLSSIPSPNANKGSALSKISNMFGAFSKVSSSNAEQLDNLAKGLQAASKIQAKATEIMNAPPKVQTPPSSSLKGYLKTGIHVAQGVLLVGGLVGSLAAPYLLGPLAAMAAPLGSGALGIFEAGTLAGYAAAAGSALAAGDAILDVVP